MKDRQAKKKAEKNKKEKGQTVGFSAFDAKMHLQLTLIKSNGLLREKSLEHGEMERNTTGQKHAGIKHDRNHSCRSRQLHMSDRSQQSFSQGRASAARDCATTEMYSYKLHQLPMLQHNKTQIPFFNCCTFVLCVCLFALFLFPLHFVNRCCINTPTHSLTGCMPLSKNVLTQMFLVFSFSEGLLHFPSTRL